MKRISLYLFVAFIVILQSCIKEDLSTCKSELLLRFRYTLNDQYVDLFDAEVDRVTIYVFDSEGKYVANFSEQGSQLTNDYVMHVPLPPGDYRIVAYGGDFNTYSAGELNSQTNTLNQTLIEGVTDINDFCIELKSIMEADNYLHPATTPDDLYVGLVNASSSSNDKEIVTVELIKNTKKIKVKITGTDFIPSALDINIIATNGRYKFDNRIDVNHGTMKYTPINTSVLPNYMEVDLKMMRLVLGQSPMLVIKNSTTSEVIYSENMIEQILLTQQYLSQEDFDREDEFVFEIAIKSNNNIVEVVVSINGWLINNIGPDM